MEFLHGPSLGAVLRREQLDVLRACRIAQQIARGLSLVHAAGVIHRDLKPDNVILLRRGEEEVARIADFGIAKMTNDLSITHKGTLMGTPRYMAPEQADGSDILGPARARLTAGRSARPSGGT